MLRGKSVAQSHNFHVVPFANTKGDKNLVKIKRVVRNIFVTSFFAAIAGFAFRLMAIFPEEISGRV